MKQVNTIMSFLVLFILLSGCQNNEENLITNAYSSEEYKVLSSNFNLPPQPFSYGFGNLNPTLETDHKATFGRALFYDKKLSSDASVSCASCHQQALAFSDDKALSQGANGTTTDRNSIALGSLKSFGAHYEEKDIDSDQIAPRLFWDERAETVREQLKQTINNPKEMDMDLQQIVDLVETTDYYQILHQKAFNSDEVTEDHILESIETFINSINSSNNLKIEYLANLNFISGDNVNGVSKHEKGAQLFNNNCNSCHTIDLSFLEDNENNFEIINTANNGLTTEQNDLGVFQYTQNPADIGKFKIPGLQNIELTAPYMHDGRFESLEEVVEFYNSGVNFNSNLHENLRDGASAKRLNLSDEDKEALVVFLKLLTDKDIISEEKWADPFL